MLEMIARSIPEWMASGEALFRMLLGVLVLLVLWEVATLLAILIGWTGDEGASTRAVPGAGRRIHLHRTCWLM